MFLTYDRPLLQIASLAEIAKMHNGLEISLADVWDSDSIMLYRGCSQTDQGIGISWTPDPVAAKQYANEPRYLEQGIVRQAMLDTDGLSCMCLMYSWADNYSYQDIEGELDLYDKSAEEQREELIKNGYDCDVILIADDYTGHNHYSHMSIIVVTEKALKQLTLV